MTDQKPKELRLKGGSAILDYINRFSDTEKVVFGVFAVTAFITALVMALRVNNTFMVEVPAHGGALHEGLIGLPHTVNPLLAVTDVDHDIASLVYAGLTRYQGGVLKPDLASDWSVSDDGLTYTFNLRPNLEFQDGSVLTANDVVFTIGKIEDSALKSPRAGDWTGVTATSTSPATVVFTLKQPNASFLANTVIGILPSHIWGKVTDDQFIFSEYNVNPVGAGPYRVAGVDRDQGGIPTNYRLTTWGDYQGKEPYVSEVDFSFFPDEEHALTALTDGTIDSLPSISPAAAKDLAANSGESYTIASAPLTRIFGVFFNQNSNPVLADLSVRQALNMSVNRNAIVKSVLDGYGHAIDSPLPPGVGTSTAVSTLADIAGAQALLRKDGWSMGADGVFAKKASKKSATTTLSFTLYTADSPDLKQAADMVKQAWTELGADVDIKVFEPGDLYQNVIRTRDYDALLFGEALGRNGDLYPFWHSSQRNAPGLNVAMYTNSKADKLLEQIRVATGTDARNTLYGQLGSVIRADVPAVFLYSPDFIYAVPKALHGLDLGTLVTPTDRFASISDWFVETDHVWNAFAH